MDGHAIGSSEAVLAAAVNFLREIVPESARNGEAHERQHLSQN